LAGASVEARGILAPMLSALSPTDVAFIMAGLAQAVPAVLWWIGGRLIGNSERVTAATSYWSAFSWASMLSFVFLVAAMSPHIGANEGGSALMLRAAGNIFNVLAVMAMQRGIWAFIGRPATHIGHLVTLTIMLAASWIGLDPAWGSVRVFVLSGLQLAMAIGIVGDLYRHGRDTLHLQRPWLLTLPVVVAAATFAARGLRAILSPSSVQAEMVVNSGLNIGSAFVYIIVALSLHAMLMSLVITRLLADLQHLSRHDGLTGLLNRRALEEALDTQVQRGRRNDEAFCMMMIDVDHFKQINDRHGHIVGDSALKHLAAVMGGHVREVDRVGRFGGEEFVVLMPGLDLAAALSVAERMRERVAAAPLIAPEGRVRISVSIGIAQWNGPYEEVSRLLVRADAALYQAKQGGRDRVASALNDPVSA
jgi:diguanylate cyclase (GGDEF)-like protein